MLLYKRTQAYYVLVFGILASRKPKYRLYVIFCYLVVLTFYLWLNRGLPRTIVLPLPTSLIHLKTTLFIICQHPHAEEVDLLLSHAKGFMFRCILVSLYSFFVQTFWVNYHLCWQGLSPCDGLSTSTVQNNSFTVERLFSELSTFLEELTVTSCQFLFFGDFNFHGTDNSNANAKNNFLTFFFSADLSSPIQAHWESTLKLVEEMWKSLLCCEMHPNVGGNCIGTLWP